MTFIFAAVEDDAAGEAVLVEEATLRLDVVEVRSDMATLLQVPKDDWHPVPQYFAVEPQRPSLEQQFPHDEFLQVSVFQDCLPQTLEVLTRNALTLRNRRAGMANNIEERIV